MDKLHKEVYYILNKSKRKTLMTNKEIIEEFEKEFWNLSDDHPLGNKLKDFLTKALTSQREEFRKRVKGIEIEDVEHRFNKDVLEAIEDLVERVKMAILEELDEVK